MSPPLLVAVIAIAAIIMLIVALVREDRARGGADYLRELEDQGHNDDYQTMLEQPPMVRLLNGLRQRFTDRQRSRGGEVSSSKYRQEVLRELTLAGRDRTIIPEMVVVAQAVMFVPGALAGWALFNMGFLSGPIGLAAIGLLGFGAAWYPRLRLRKKGKKRSAQIAKDLPDLLELTSMGISAGLAIDAALETVLGDFEGPLAEELRYFLDDEALGVSRKDALERVRDRTDVRQLGQLMVTLTQADEMGMPVSSLMKNTAKEARLKRSQEARETAAKLPVKMLIPLVFCVFPPILVIIMGPAVATIRETLG